jgi:gamma-glutamyl phosphate reductase
MDTRQKNTLLNKMAAAIEANAPRILQANALDSTSPIGSGKVATWRMPSAIAVIRSSVKRKRSCIVSETRAFRCYWNHL